MMVRADPMLLLLLIGLLLCIAALAWAICDNRRLRAAAETRGPEVDGRRYRAIFDQAMEGIYQSSPQGRFIDVNGAMADIFGYPSPEAMLEEVTDIAGQIYVEPGTRAMFLGLMDRQGEVRGIEVRVRRRDGTLLWITENSHAVRDTWGQVLYYEGTVQDITARRRAEEALRRSEERFRDIAEAAGDYLWEVDAEGRYSFVTERISAVLGYAPAELIGKAPAAFVAADERVAVQAFFDDVARRKAPFANLELRSIAKDGRIVWQRVGGVPVFAADGALAGYRGAGTNITAEVEAKREHQRAREKLQAVLSALPDRMIQVDPEGTVLDCHMPQPKPPEALIGQPVAAVLPAEVAAAGRAALAAAIRTGQVQSFEYSVTAAAGERMFYEARVAPLREAGALLLIRDITAWRKAEEVLRESERRYRLLADNATDMISLHASDGRFRYVSPSCRRVLGYAPEVLVGADPYDLFHPEDMAAIREAHEAILGDEGICDITYRMRHEQGHWVWLETVSTRVDAPSAEGGIAIVAVTRDVTERVRFAQDLQNERDRVHEQAVHLREAARSLAIARQEAEAAQLAAEQANRAKSQFLATMSHELRTPLNVVLGFAEMIRDRVHGEAPDGWDRYAEYASDIHASGTHLLDLINDILDISKIEAGRLEIGPEWLDLASLLTAAMRQVRMRAAERRLRLGLTLAKPAPRLCADERAVRQIVANLLSNAIKFTPEGGSIDITARGVEPDLVEIAVIDSGIGIPAEQLARVVLPFEQLDNRYSRAAGGTGLGLALVKALAELHGGGIRIDSVVDKGTTVTVTLPQIPPGAAEA